MRSSQNSDKLNCYLSIPTMHCGFYYLLARTKVHFFKSGVWFERVWAYNHRYIILTGGQYWITFALNYNTE